LDTENLLNTIKCNTLKLNKLLETLLLLSRIENGVEKIIKEKVDASFYIKNNTEKLLNNFKNNENFKINNIKIIYKLSENEFICTEKRLFNILFENILKNAIKFSKNNGNIEI
jgi:signal transduction histidine kinase